ncbi:MAG: hypothetical protein GXC76_10890 [Rhodanobacteraceae bacterium]|jgi:hypothetical protein|nr:hypothetical protein [Rhodanobacteraceae bacterium]
MTNHKPPAEARAPTPIPRGGFCYDTEHVAANPATGEAEYWVPHYDRRCPYWRRTDHATVCCDYLGVEHVDDTISRYRDILAAHFGSNEEADKHVGHSLLYDEIKICGINTDADA